MLNLRSESDALWIVLLDLGAAKPITLGVCIGANETVDAATSSRLGDRPPHGKAFQTSPTILVQRLVKDGPPTARPHARLGPVVSVHERSSVKSAA